MTEQVIRHRGGGRDKRGQLIPATDAPMTALEVAPGGGSESVERGRDSESTACTVFFDADADIVNADELTVRGERFSIVVNDWRPAGFEVLCNRGQG